MSVPNLVHFSRLTPRTRWEFTIFSHGHRGESC